MAPAALELCALTATDLSALLEKRKVSAVEIADALLARIDELDDELGAFICVEAERVRAEAMEAQRDLMAGRRKGPVHGIPIAHKDIFDARGYATTAASRLTSWNRVVHDSAIVEDLRDRGAIVLGKTNTTEFAAGTMEVFGESHNPWDLRMTPGTSSAGSAVAVAACLSPIATGSDTGGSIRIPAAYCGVVGLKPTYGWIGQKGMAPFSHSFDTPGFLARSVSDVALACGRSAKSFSSKLRGVTLGIPRSFFFDDLDPEVADRVEDAIETLRRLGAGTVELEIRHAALAGAAFFAIAYTDALTAYKPQIVSRHADFTRPLLVRMLAAACLSQEERLMADLLRRAIAGEFTAALAAVDAIVTSTTATAATPLGSAFSHLDRNRFTRPANLAGIPAMSVPCGFTANGLPVGLQLLARHESEDMLLRIAYAYERSTEWHVRHPSLDLPNSAGPSIAPGRPRRRTRDRDAVAEIFTCLRNQGFDFVHEELAAEIAETLEPVRAALPKESTPR